MPDAATLLFRPVGQKEFDLIAGTGFKSFPPRLEGQPIFYPVLNEEYATFIARDWNTIDAASGFIGYVLRFSCALTIWRDSRFRKSVPPRRLSIGFQRSNSQSSMTTLWARLSLFVLTSQRKPSPERRGVYITCLVSIARSGQASNTHTVVPSDIPDL
jgi:hypothetical protein